MHLKFPYPSQAANAGISATNFSFLNQNNWPLPDWWTFFRLVCQDNIVNESVQRQFISGISQWLKSSWPSLDTATISGMSGSGSKTNWCLVTSPILRQITFFSGTTVEIYKLSKVFLILTRVHVCPLPHQCPTQLISWSHLTTTILISIKNG